MCIRDSIKDGFGKEQLDVDDYAETAIISRNFNELMSGMTVSYTHLDVYKRQARSCHCCSKQVFVLINCAGLYTRYDVVLTELITDILYVKL